MSERFKQSKGADDKKMDLVQAPRVSVSREKRVNLERANPQRKYESETVFISMQKDVEKGLNHEDVAEHLLEQTEVLAKAEETRILKRYS